VEVLYVVCVYLETINVAQLVDYFGKTEHRLLIYNMVYNEKAIAESKFDDVADIASGKDNCCIRVRVVRLWKVPAFLNPSEYGSLEMVLIDEKVSIYLIFFMLCFLVNFHPFGVVFCFYIFFNRSYFTLDLYVIGWKDSCFH
jgi:hypothetical protein